MRPPIDLAVIDGATDAAIASGHRLFQTHRFADTDIDHVTILLDLMDLPEGAMVLDAGCGIGEVSRLMSDARPDLSFILMNLSMHQLSKCPTGEQYLHALDDCHATMLNDAVVDGVMFSSALCQMDIEVALAEARRVLKPGGILLVNDMQREDGDVEALEQAVAARVLAGDQLARLVWLAGFEIDSITSPESDSRHFAEMAQEAGISALVNGIKPIIIRATARKEAV